MPNYPYKCGSCHNEFEVQLPREQCTTAQPCPSCQTASARQLAAIGFVLQGDGWTGKGFRLREQMGRKNQRLGKRGAEKLRDAPGLTLVPNVGGEQVDSWSDAAKLAASQGKDASLYAARAGVA